MKCPECGNEITAEMQEMGLCYECGYNLRKAAMEKWKREEEKRQEAYKKAEQQRIVNWKAAHPDAEGKYFQYKTIVIPDKAYGQVDTYAIESALNRMGYEGWRLVSTFTNEVGKNLSSFGVGGISSGTNATIDETVLIFERVARIE